MKNTSQREKKRKRKKRFFSFFLNELKRLLLTCLVLFLFGLETVLSSIKLNKNFLRRETGDERSSLFSCYTRKWKWNQLALLSTLFTLNDGQFSPKRNHTWSCRAPSEEGAPLPRSWETEKSEVLNVSRDLESWRAILGKIKKWAHLALRGVAKIKFWLSLFHGKEQSCLFCWCLYWYVGAELSFTSSSSFLAGERNQTLWSSSRPGWVPTHRGKYKPSRGPLVHLTLLLGWAQIQFSRGALPGPACCPGLQSPSAQPWRPGLLLNVRQPPGQPELSHSRPQIHCGFTVKQHPWHDLPAS